MGITKTEYFLNLYLKGELEETVNEALGWDRGYLAKAFIKPENSKARPVINIDVKSYII